MSSRFYKYQPINDRRIGNLSKNQLYFSNPCNFKDPEDCKIRVYNEGTEREWIEHYKQNNGFTETKTTKMIKEGLDKGFLQKKDGLISYNPDHEGHSKEYRDLLYGGLHRKSLPLVTCFCGSPYNAYMWNEYADKHKGFCLCFKSHSTDNKVHKLTFNSKEEIVYPVTYEPMPQNRLNLLKYEDIKKIGKRLVTKDPEYVNENEYRVMIITQRNLNTYKRKELEGIIFGFYTSPEKEKEIHTIAKRIYKDVKFYKVIDIQDEVKIKPINDNYFKSL